MIEETMRRRCRAPVLGGLAGQGSGCKHFEQVTGLDRLPVRLPLFSWLERSLDTNDHDTSVLILHIGVILRCVRPLRVACSTNDSDVTQISSNISSRSLTVLFHRFTRQVDAVGLSRRLWQKKQRGISPFNSTVNTNEKDVRGQRTERTQAVQRRAKTGTRKGRQDLDGEKDEKVAGET